MKRNQVVVGAALLVILIGIGSYLFISNSLGNKVEIESVMATEEGGTATEGASASPNAESQVNEALSADQMNGVWNIADESKVYWSVTTSKETVNFVNEEVTGQWTVDINEEAAMTGKGAVDMNGLSSGNEQRDSHVKERPDLLETSQYPEATFVAKSFSPLPETWTEGTSVPLTMTGTLSVKGLEKEVIFESEAMYKGGQLLLSGKTTVAFSDFGMKSPHTIVLEAENDLSVQLELVLNKT
ncbi:YceI family protein [Paenibacillus sp. GSMTC-2017]|nr:YceI family protein [Paenibacillus sp. GSMTC-2017]